MVHDRIGLAPFTFMACTPERLPGVRSGSHVAASAVAEGGVVVLNGPDGVAVTMTATATAAAQTGASLLQAAAAARGSVSDGTKGENESDETGQSQ